MALGGKRTAYYGTLGPDPDDFPLGVNIQLDRVLLGAESGPNILQASPDRWKKPGALPGRVARVEK